MTVIPLRSTAQLLTRADIFGRKTTDAVHMDFGGGRSAWSCGIEGLPRLTVWTEHNRMTGSRRLWAVDGTTVRDLDAALAVLNGTMTPEEAMPQPDPPSKPQKFSIDAQIEEVQFELARRETDYPRIAGRDQRKRSELEHHVKLMQAVLRSLEWMRDRRAELTAKMVEAQGEGHEAQAQPDQGRGG